MPGDSEATKQRVNCDKCDKQYAKSYIKIHMKIHEDKETLSNGSVSSGSDSQKKQHVQDKQVVMAMFEDIDLDEEEDNNEYGSEYMDLVDRQAMETEVNDIEIEWFNDRFSQGQITPDPQGDVYEESKCENCDNAKEVEEFLKADMDKKDKHIKRSKRLMDQALAKKMFFQNRAKSLEEQLNDRKKLNAKIIQENTILKTQVDSRDAELELINTDEEVMNILDDGPVINETAIEVGGITCTSCDYVAKTQRILKGHYKWAHGPHCKKCGRKFLVKDALEAHMIESHSGGDTKQSEKVPKVPKAQSKKFCCNACDKLYPSLRDLTEHLKSHGEIRSHRSKSTQDKDIQILPRATCGDCGHRETSKLSMNKHVQLCQAKPRVLSRTFSCDQCDYESTTINGLDSHIEEKHQHQDTIPICRFYKRGHCKKGSECKYKHCEPQPKATFACDQCDKTTTSGKQMSDHIEKIHMSKKQMPSCRYFRQGRCEKGNKCKFIHEGSNDAGYGKNTKNVMKCRRGEGCKFKEQGRCNYFHPGVGVQKPLPPKSQIPKVSNISVQTQDQQQSHKKLWCKFQESCKNRNSCNFKHFNKDFMKQVEMNLYN